MSAVELISACVRGCGFAPTLDEHPLELCRDDHIVVVISLLSIAMPAEPTKRLRTISATEFKAHCLAIMDEVMRTGDEFLITKHGRVVARLVAPEGAIPSAHGWMRGTVAIVGDPTEPDDVWSLGNSPFPRD